MLSTALGLGRVSDALLCSQLQLYALGEPLCCSFELAMVSTTAKGLRRAALLPFCTCCAVNCGSWGHSVALTLLSIAAPRLGRATLYILCHHLRL